MSSFDVLLVALWLAPVFIVCGSVWALAWWALRRGVMR